jgi:hypothetical protein
MVNGCGVVGGVKVIREIEVLGENLPNCHLADKEYEI